MDNPKVLVHDFDRPNIHLAVKRFRDDDEKLAAMLVDVAHTPTPGIIYAATRKATEEIATALNDQNIEARAYHAGLKGSEREAIQQAFMHDEIGIIVATIAFGMGIDKSNVHFVYHYDISDSLDSYYQEIGRAGRDDQPANAILYYVPEDMDLRRFQAGAGQLVPDEVEPVVRELRRKRKPADPIHLEAASELTDTRLTRVIDRLDDLDAIDIDSNGCVTLTDKETAPETLSRQAVDIQGTLQQYEQSRLEMMRQYADLEQCRRAFLLRYFDQDARDTCEGCDNCDSGSTEASHIDHQQFPDSAEVIHAEWGDGKVIQNNPDTITVRFDSVGYKTLAVELVESEGLLKLKSSETAPA